MLSRDELIYECDTPYGHYQVYDMIYEGRPARVLFTGNRTAAFSGMPLDDEHEMLFDYIQRLYELVSTIRPQRVLMIGGGTYTLPLTLVQTLPDIIMDVIEIDPGLDAIAEAFFGLTNHERLSIIHTDGRSYLKEHKQQYDMIIIDAFSGLQIPKSLADVAAVDLIKSRLSINGILAMNIISSYHGANARPAEYFYDLYNPRFETVNIYPADRGISLWSAQNMVLVAQVSAVTQDIGFTMPSLGTPAAA